MPLYIPTHNISLAGNTAGALALVSSGTLTLAGGNLCTLSQAGNAISISVNGNLTAAQTVQTQNLHDVTLSGNSTSGGAGFQLISSGTMTLAGGNNVTLSQAGYAVTVSAANIPYITLSGNTKTAGAGLALISNGTMTLAGGSNITLSQNGNAVTVSAGFARSYLEINGPAGSVAVAALTNASYSHRPIFVPFDVDVDGMSANSVRLLLSRPAGTSLACTMGVGVYSMVNSTSMALAFSTTQGYSLTTSAQFSGVRIYDIPLAASTMSKGHWMLGYHLSASTTNTAVGNLQMLGLQSQTVIAGIVFTGTNSTGATTASQLIRPWLGVYSVTANLLPSNVGQSDLLGAAGGSQAAPYWALIRNF